MAWRPIFSFVHASHEPIPCSRGMVRIDLNCDVGESFGAYTIGDDHGVLAHVTSANIACGAHAGDPGTMRTTIRLAQDRGVSIGAHPGFADLSGFGRREIGATTQEIEDLVAFQVGALIGIARTERAHVTHVKPHGALYNLASRDRPVADAIARAVAGVDAALTLFGLSGSVLLDAGREVGLSVAAEVFADRAYAGDGSLVSRRATGAVLTDPQGVVDRAIRMVTEGIVVATDGTSVDLVTDTICVHGDTPGAADMAQALRAGLEAAGVEVGPIR